MARSFKVAFVVSIAMAALIYVTLERGRSVRANRALEQLPRSARAVLRVDLIALSKAPAARSLVEAFLGEGVSDLEATCGLEPRLDLADVTIWIRGSDVESFQAFGLVLTGRRVDAERLVSCHTALVESRGSSVVRIDEPSGPLLASVDRTSAIAPLDAQTVVAGSLATVTETVAVRRGRVPNLAERERIALLWSEVSRGSAIAAALDLPARWRTALDRLTAIDSTASPLEGVEAIGLAVETASAAAEVHLLTGSSAIAATSAKRLRAWVEHPPQVIEPPWTAVIRSARISTDAERVRIELDLSSLSTPL